jgi:hypothetical protein
MHCRPDVHALPHRPQFSASAVVSRHMPSHRSTPSPSHGGGLGVALLVDTVDDVPGVEDTPSVTVLGPLEVAVTLLNDDVDEDDSDDEGDAVLLDDVAGSLLLLLKVIDTLLTADELELLAELDSELLLAP